MDSTHNKQRPMTQSAIPVQEQGVLGDEREINLVELFYYLIEKFIYIAIAAVLGTIIAVLITFLVITPKYEAVSKLYVLNSGDSAVNLSDLQIGAYLADDYQEVFKTWEVHEMVLKNLGLDYSYSEMQSMLRVGNPTDTRILTITITSPDPAEATAIANEYANVARLFISETMETEEPNILSVALEPKSPASPNKSLNIILGFMIGALLAVAVFVMKYIMDDRIHTVEDIERYTGLATLAVVPVQVKDTQKTTRRANRR